MSIICPVREAVRTQPRASKSETRGKHTELEPVAYHLQAALQSIRDLPVAGIDREKYYTYIYQLMSAALTLVVEDSIYGQPDLIGNESSAELLSDLDAIRGG